MIIANHSFLAFQRPSDKSSYSWKNSQPLRFGKNNNQYQWNEFNSRASLPLQKPQYYFCKDTVTGEKKYVMSAEHVSDFPNFEIVDGDFLTVNIESDRYIFTGVSSPHNIREVGRTNASISFNIENDLGVIADWHLLKAGFTFTFYKEQWNKPEDLERLNTIIRKIAFRVRDSAPYKCEDLFNVIDQGISFSDTIIRVNGTIDNELIQALTGASTTRGNPCTLEFDFESDNHNIYLSDLIVTDGMSDDIYGTMRFDIEFYL